MARTTSLTKRSLISKANSTIVTATAIAAFVLIFSLIASKALFSQMAYQNRVISAKKEAVAQLKDNLEARDSLVTSYKSFVERPQNMLGGDPSGSGPQDGDNAKIVLDALPSVYDFPALATSLEKLITSQNLQITGITGTDQELEQQVASEGTPQPVPMPFQIQVTGSYDSIKNLVDLFNRSVRPFQTQTMSLGGNQSNMTLTLSAQTYYQPEKTFKINTQVVK
jgi:hypothetical protein